MKTFAVIGCGRFGAAVAKTLYELGNEVMAIDISEEAINELSDEVTIGIQADVKDEKALKDIGLSNCDAAIISIASDIEASIMSTLIAKEMGIKRVIAKAQSEMHGKILYKIGADKVIFPERDMGVRVAHNLSSTHILDFIELSQEYSILEITALREWENKSLSQLKLPTKYRINVMAIRRNNSINISPSGEEVIQKDDIIVVIGSTKDINKIEYKVGK